MSSVAASALQVRLAAAERAGAGPGHGYSTAMSSPQCYRLIYASRSAVTTSPEGIAAILETARRKNREEGVTGLLYFDHRTFLQALEGTREAVNRTFQRIGPDPRHADVTLLFYAAIQHRAFSDWAMVYLAETEATQAALRRFDTKGGGLDLAALSEWDAAGVIDVLKPFATGEASTSLPRMP